MTKFFVKKPYFVLVTVIIVLVVGFVSLSEMQSRSSSRVRTAVHGGDYDRSRSFSGKGGE